MIRKVHIAVAAVLLAAAATSAAAEILTVTTTVDDELRAGSLRAVLDRALPGDEIIFDVLRPVVLERRLDIVVDGLSISGPVTITSVPVVDDANTKRKLSVLSSDVTISAMEFDSVVMRVGETAHRCTLVDSFFHGRGGKLFLEGATDTTIGTVFSVDLVVDGNRFRDAGVFGYPDSATVQGNDIRIPLNGRQGDGVFLHSTPRHAQPGLVEVLSNRISNDYGNDGISVGRRNAVVRGNTVRAPLFVAEGAHVEQVD